MRLASVVTRGVTVGALVLLCATAASAQPAAARVTAQPGTAAPPSDGWEVNLAPLYLWASEIDGEMRVNDATVPVYMSFGDAVDSLAGIFTFHLEARKNRWGLLSDLAFVRLSTDAQFTAPPLLPGGPGRVVTGEVSLDNIVFEVGASYLVLPNPDFSIIGGLRTYTMSPKIEFTAGPLQTTPVDTSHTAATAFAGIAFRPRLSEKWYFVGRADIGGGDGMSWRSTAAFQFQFNQRAGILFGYHALGVDVGTVGPVTTLPAGRSAGPSVEYDVTHYGPLVALNLRWGR